MLKALHAYAVVYMCVKAGCEASAAELSVVAELVTGATSAESGKQTS